MPSLIVPITEFGAIVDVVIGVSRPRSLALSAIGMAVPQVITVRMVIDTGASITGIDKGLLQSLGLPSRGTVPLHTASTAGTPISCDLFDVSMVFPQTMPTGWGIQQAVILACPPFHGQVQGMLGRDVLNSSVMSYNGVANSVTLSL